MRCLPWIVGVVVAVTGCAVGGEETGAAYSSTSGDEAAVSSGLLYFYVSPLEPGSQGFGPLALRRANAKPTTLSPTYGAATIPGVKLAGDAVTTQAALNNVINTPFAGHENSVIAIIGGRDKGGLGDPLVEVVELYTPSQPVAIKDAAGVTGVAQKDALFALSTSGSKVTAKLVNEKDYEASNASSITYDYSGSTNPAAAKVAVAGGALFTGKVDVVCKKVLIFWTKCDPPSGVHVNAYFAAAQ